LGARRQNKRLEDFDVGRKLRCNLAHAPTESDSCAFVNQC
jgi:hypothetical protein